MDKTGKSSQVNRKNISIVVVAIAAAAGDDIDVTAGDEVTSRRGWRMVTSARYV